MRYDVTWIEEGLKKPGKKKGALAEALGRAPSAVTSLLRGERLLKAHEIEIIARYLEVDAPPTSGSFAMRTTVKPLGDQIQVRIDGIVEAGAFREADDANQDEAEYVSADLDKRWPDARQVAFRVAGDSMNALKPVPILDGATVICVDYSDIADRYPMRNGMIVVVERVAMGGHMREWSVKQLEVKDDRFIFHPRSTNAKHKPIVVTTDFEADDGMQVGVLALVREITNQVAD